MNTNKTKKVLAYSLILILLLFGGGYAGYRGYQHVRQTRLVKQAKAYLDPAKPNPRKALLCLQRALRYNPRDVAACRLMAQLTEAARSPSALIWRGRVVEYNPHSVDDRLALAQTAMMFRDYASATNALEGIDPAGKKTAAYHNLAGALASTVNQLPQAEMHFAEASRLEPLNTVPQLNLAIVRLRGSNAPALADARATLKRISVNPTNSALRCQALRELVVDAMRHKQTEPALALSQQLLLETNSIFSDHLIRLEVLQETRNAEFKPTLMAFQREASADPTNNTRICELAMWQISKVGAPDTLAWLRRLPMDTQTNPAVAMLVAECQTATRDWPGLQKFVENQNWGELDFVRRAFKARALRGQELTSAAKVEWELALKVSGNQKQSLAMLLRMAAQWNWQSEAEELLWAIYNRYPDDRRAFQALTQALYAGGRTRPLMMLFNQELKRSPANLDLKNNLAVMALLLEANELKPHELAREIYSQASTNGAYASTYAFSLHLQQKNADALKIMQKISPKELESPGIAGYYGLILKATGDHAKAKPYLDWAFKDDVTRGAKAF